MKFSASNLSVTRKVVSPPFNSAVGPIGFSYRTAAPTMAGAEIKPTAAAIAARCFLTCFPICRSFKIFNAGGGACRHLRACYKQEPCRVRRTAYFQCLMEMASPESACQCKEFRQVFGTDGEENLAVIQDVQRGSVRATTQPLTSAAPAFRSTLVNSF